VSEYEAHRRPDSEDDGQMLAQVMSATLVGVDGVPVTVEVDLIRRLPGMSMGGMLARAVKESPDRVRSSVEGAGWDWPKKRVVVNLAPSNLPKVGTGFDLPIAVALLRAAGEIPPGPAERFLLVGELGLTGEVRPVPGVLAAALAARNAGLEGVVVPRENGAEAALVEGLEVWPVTSLVEVASLLAGESQPQSVAPPQPLQFRPHEPDLCEVRGLPWPRFALEVAAAGGHNLMLVGPPGTGKSMLSQRLPSILPPLTRDEALEVTRIHSAGGVLPPGAGLVERRPFRAPHHTVTPQALAGGGAPIRPGEITLAHLGVLFLDEMPEFQRSALEVLRQPLEDQAVAVARAAARVSFPADFQLVATANPCNCGYVWDNQRPCQCNPHQVQVYRNRLSGPLLDRIDIFAYVPRVAYEELGSAEQGEPSAAVRRRVLRAREVQLERFADRPAGLRRNARMSRADLERFCALHDEAKQLMKRCVDEGSLSARAHDRVLRVARTVADLRGNVRLSTEDVVDAVDLRVGAHPLESMRNPAEPADAPLSMTHKSPRPHAAG
jgi:magnesium chelatase family protein